VNQADSQPSEQAGASARQDDEDAPHGTVRRGAVVLYCARLDAAHSGV
jgi:hypothetical protein